MVERENMCVVCMCIPLMSTESYISEEIRILQNFQRAKLEGTIFPLKSSRFQAGQRSLLPCIDRRDILLGRYSFGKVPASRRRYVVAQ